MWARAKESNLRWALRVELRRRSEKGEAIKEVNAEVVVDDVCCCLSSSAGDSPTEVALLEVGAVVVVVVVVVGDISMARFSCSACEANNLDLA